MEVPGKRDTVRAMKALTASHMDEELGAAVLLEESEFRCRLGPELTGFRRETPCVEGCARDRRQRSKTNECGKHR